MNNPEKLLKDLLNSDSFDELVAYRLNESLNTQLDELRQSQSNLSCENNRQDYVECIKYCRSLVGVLEWFTMGDYGDTITQINKYSLVLEDVF
jgi:hypothetical protein